MTYRLGGGCNLTIYKEKNNNQTTLPYAEQPEISTVKSRWNDEKIKDIPKILWPVNTRDSKESISNSWAYSLKEDPTVVFTKINKPLLFYAPINYLGTNFPENELHISKDFNYFKDFAVLEINFEDEITSQIITDNFYNKYKNQNPINFFAPEITKEKTLEELEKNEEDYFFAGYPGNSYNRYRAFGNYSSEKKLAAKLLKYKTDQEQIYVKNKNNQPILGHANPQVSEESYEVIWNKKITKTLGYQYTVIGTSLGAGASGSLVTNKNGDVLGLLTSGEEEQNYSRIYRSQTTITPLRSEGIFKDGKIIQPRYDLIRGARGQLGSYKEQLDTYFPYLKTRLRKIGWK